ncbi:DUF3040 domain-containing protein [Pseudonocardia nigra]|uniref:DUF3040 domain-containing protein n=1 Tax=Pseudonocardia nigra TaxID=1921578 RepID=UPI001C5FB3EC|nr:DUF3040 domain-containing protein [Pseudonocardia nigra]
MLNQDDRRRLEAIERQLQATDPDLAHLLTHWPVPARVRWAMSTAVLTVVIGTLGVLMGMMTFSPLLILLSGSITVTGWMWLLRRRRPSQSGSSTEG